jgi:protein TonB
MEKPSHSLRSSVAAGKSPTRRAIQIGVVALLHIGLIYGLSSGLAKALLTPPPEPIAVDITQQELPKDVPPPPPPEQVKPPPPPVVPPPDITIAADIAPPPTNTITTTTVKPVEAKPDPMAGVTVAVKKRNVDCGATFYPALSARMHEEGTVGLKMIIGTDGVPKNVEVAQSSGKPRLDEAAVACVKTFRYTPAMKDGQPIEIPGNPSVVWKLQ